MSLLHLGRRISQTEGKSRRKWQFVANCIEVLALSVLSLYSGAIAKWLACSVVRTIAKHSTRYYRARVGFVDGFRLNPSFDWIDRFSKSGAANKQISIGETTARTPGCLSRIHTTHGNFCKGVQSTKGMESDEN